MIRKNCTATKAAPGYDHITSRTTIMMMSHAELLEYLRSCKRYDEFYEYAQSRLFEAPRPTHRT